MVSRFVCAALPIAMLGTACVPVVDPAARLLADVDALVGGTSLADKPGLAVLVAQHGKVLLEKGYGLADVESRVAITSGTRFRIGSITKPFTAAAILKLQEQGKLRVEDTLAKFIPDWPRGAEVTLYHLLTHTSGISNYTAKPTFSANVTQGIALDDLIRSFRDDPYDFAPGTQFRYDNSGYVLLGFVVEKASGLSYADYLHREFFEPLAMKDTGVDEAGPAIGRHALGYSYEGGVVRRSVNWDISRLAGAGVLHSTVGDLYRWNEGLLNGRILSAASVKAAFTVGFVAGDDARFPEETGYGLGWIIDTLRGQREIGHGGELAGFGGYLLRLPAHELTVVVLLNSVPQLPGLQQWMLARNIAAATLGQALPPEQPLTGAATVTVAALDAIVGRYDMGPGVVLSVTREENRVFFEVAGRSKTEMFPRSDRAFYVGAGAAEATFVSDGSGKVVKAILKQAGGRIDAPKIPVP